MEQKEQEKKSLFGGSLFGNSEEGNDSKDKKSSLSQQLFGQHKPKELSPEQKAIASKINDLNIRLKVIEDRYTGLRRKTQLTEQNILSTNKKITAEVKTLSSEFNDVKHVLSEITSKLKEMKQEISRCAKREELNILNRYIDYWEPLNYVTEEQIIKMIDGTIQKQKV